MNIEYKKVKVNECKPNEYNPNVMTESQMEHLRREILRIGFLQPILINKDNMIIDGEHRWLAGKDLGMEEIPAVVIDVDLKTAKTATLTMNQIKGEINPVKMAELLESLKEDYSVGDLSNILDLSELEIESYTELNELPDIGDIDIPDKEPNLIKCPECGHQFEK